MDWTDLLALTAIIWWPLIPLFWIPVHGLSRWARHIGLFIYILIFLVWTPLAYILYINQSYLLGSKIDLPIIVNIIGWCFFASGMILHIWTGLLLRPWGLIGLPEIFSKVESKLVTTGPFSIVRHPTYLAHTFIFFGVFLLSEVIAAGVVALLDLIIVYAIIIPLEERELLNRFGDEYRQYQQEVPRFIPF